MLSCLSSILLFFILILLILVSPIWIGMKFAPNPGSDIGKWYDALKKPSFNPPKWIFAPVWTVLYVLMGISVYIICCQYYGHKQAVIEALILFFIQYLLNILWMPLFFGKKQMLMSFLIIVILLFMIFLTMLKFYQISLMAFYLLIPYAGWSLFATVLSFKILKLNLAMLTLPKK